ncbi:MAG TPA: hypothetical protein VHE12_08980 [bacterium]|nr:hypothetical protein [bacterium]
MKRPFPVLRTISLALLLASGVSLWAEGTTPDPDALAPAPQSGPGSQDEKQPEISKPSSVPAESEGSTASNPKPSQGEGEKAPATARPTVMPEFSLPEVVITGENELTIGAKRLSTQENDVTLGSRDLTGLERSRDDLPGLNKTFTALSTEESGPARDHALVLHLGGGIPETYGGWGLWGQQFKDFQYLLDGSYSNWGGETTGSGKDGDRRWGLGLQTEVLSKGPLGLAIGGRFSRRDAELPYQGSVRELLDAWGLSAKAHWTFPDLTRLEAGVEGKVTGSQAWDFAPQSHRVEEWEGQAKWTAEALDPLLNKAVLSAGVRHASSDLPGPGVPGYDWGWIEAQGTFQWTGSLSLDARLQAQAGNGFDLPLALYPALNMTWRVFGNSQIDLFWANRRTLGWFQDVFVSQERTAPATGLPSPTEDSDQWGGRYSQKVSEDILFSLSGSTGRVQGYHQWTDLQGASPTYVQDYSTLGQVQLTRAGASLQWNFQRDWQVAAVYQRNWAENQSGDGRSITGLPDQKAILSLYRGDDKLETRLELAYVGAMGAFEDAPGTLDGHLTLGLAATYHLERSLSLWLDGDNLTGQDFQLQPGYWEPRFHLRAGIETIF